MFCSHCGKEYGGSESLKFCPNCGSPLGNPGEAAVEKRAHVRKYKCPKCGSYHVRVYDQMTGSTGNLSQMTRTTSVGYSVASYRTMWQCEDCGFSFQDPDGKRKHLKEIKMAFNFLAFGLSCAVALPFALLMGPFGLLAGVLFFALSVAAIRSITKKKLCELDEFEKTVLTHQ